MAARLGKLDFVQLLVGCITRYVLLRLLSSWAALTLPLTRSCCQVQAGAAVNDETATGNTALIEAVKSMNLGVITFLTKSGALARLKTTKHRRSAIDWANTLGAKMISRTLEIYGIVQSQIGEIFCLIACGRNDKVLEIIRDGDLFDPQNSSLLGTKLNVLFEEQDDTLERIDQSQKTCRHQDEAVLAAKAKYEDMLSAVARSENRCKQIAQDIIDHEMTIHEAFRKFEEAAASTHRSDLEELCRMRKPDMTVRLAVLIFGIMYSILDPDPSHVYATDMKLMMPWWRKVMVVMQSSGDTMKRLKGFSLAKLNGPHGGLLLSRARAIYQQLAVALGRVNRSKGGDEQPLMPSIDFLSSVDQAVLSSPSTSARSELKDEDWDSDAEEAVGGSWVKGEWVPIIHKKERWWERGTKGEKAREPSAAGPVGFVVPEEGERANAYPKYEIVVLDPAFKLRRDDASDTKSVRGAGAADTDDEDEFATSPHFVKAMVQLVDSAETYAAAQPLFVAARTRTMDAQQECNEMKLQMRGAQLDLEKHVNLRSESEEGLISSMKRSKHLKKQIVLNRSKVRVARLLNHVTATGHTVVSWAASYGAYEVVESLLSHGATVGYTEDLLELCASVIQLSYRIYRFIRAAKSQLSEMSALSAQLEGGNMQLIEEIGNVKENRDNVLGQVRWRRRLHRLPIVEAAYAGKWEIIARIHERRMFCVKFSEAWSYPLLRPPYRRTNHLLDGRIPLLEILAHGMSDVGAGEYDPTAGGWSQPGGPLDPYSVAFEEISKVLNDKAAKKVMCINERRRKRLLTLEKRNQLDGADEMTAAIVNYDMRKCIWLAAKRLISIDTEIDLPGSNQDGETALLKASEENAGAVNHKMMVNDDGSSVLQVAFLLDRSVHRPSVNQLNKFGQSALMRACARGRPYVVQALLDRSADVNLVNKYNQTALHFAVQVGNTECIRVLLERGVDIQLVDHQGNTAYDIASENGFTLAMSQMSRFSGGNMGSLAPSRGNVNDTITCPNGCGLFLFSYDVADHNAVCELRVVDCPNGCKLPRIMYKELGEHLSDICSHMILPCELCGEPIKKVDAESHMQAQCSSRGVFCEMCKTNVKFCELAYHLGTCFGRPKQCPLNCGETITPASELFHTTKECGQRRVECPLKCSVQVISNQLLKHLTEQCLQRPSECTFCQKTLKETERRVHEKTCEDRREACKCGEFVNIKHTKEHLQNACPLRFVDCKATCGLKVRVVDMETHMKVSCGNRLVPCPLGCLSVTSLDPDVTLVTHRTLQAHLTHVCPNREVKCGLCSAAIAFPEADIHKALYCGRRLVQCRIPRCEKQLSICDREEHERFKCRFRPIVCPQGCGDFVLAIQAGKHIAEACDMRFVECPLHCGDATLRHRQLLEHLKGDCVRRGSPASRDGKRPSSPSKNKG